MCNKGHTLQTNKAKINKEVFVPFYTVFAKTKQDKKKKDNIFHYLLGAKTSPIMVVNH